MEWLVIGLLVGLLIYQVERYITEERRRRRERKRSDEIWREFRAKWHDGAGN